MKAGVYLLVSGLVLLTTFGGCGKKKTINWEDEQLARIVYQAGFELKDLKKELSDEERYELENYASEPYDDDNFCCYY